MIFFFDFWFLFFFGFWFLVFGFEVGFGVWGFGSWVLGLGVLELGLKNQGFNFWFFNFRGFVSRVWGSESGVQGGLQVYRGTSLTRICTPPRTVGKCLL